MTPVLVLCILLCAASAAPAEKENLPADVSEPQEEMMRMMVKEEEQELPEDLVPELIDAAAESEQVEYPDARFAPCPFGWHLYSSICYRVFSPGKSWYDAAENCYSQGAQLASVTNSRQYIFLQQLSISLNVQSPWLGGFYVQNQWMWTDGQRISYDGWSAQYSGTSNPCVYLRTDAGWTNSACSSSRHYICAKQAGC